MPEKENCYEQNKKNEKYNENNPEFHETMIVLIVDSIIYLIHTSNQDINITPISRRKELPRIKRLKEDPH